MSDAGKGQGFVITCTIFTKFGYMMHIVTYPLNRLRHLSQMFRMLDEKFLEQV